jgi:NitT/TauT family transport system permease protein
MSQLRATAAQNDTTEAADTTATNASNISAVASRPAPWHQRARVQMLAIVLPLLLLGFWTFSSVNNVFGPGLLPTPVASAEAYQDWMLGKSRGLVDPFSGTWARNVIASAVRVVIGVSCAALVGIVLGVLIGRSRAVELLFDPTIQGFRPVPVTAWVPFTLIFFGINPAAAISLIFVAAFFPILVNSTAGAQQVPVALIRAGKMLGASEAHLLRRVVLPSALPSIFTGLRLGIGMGWVAVIVAEMIGVKSGLGYILWQAYYWNRMDMLICTVFTIGVLGFLSDRVVYVYARRKFLWASR